MTLRSITFSPDDWITIARRLLLALLMGGVVGWNRQRTGKAAGLRTHMLVSLGAAIFVMIPLQVQTTDSTDTLGRSIQGIATGIGFLGAGEILHRQHSTNAPKVKGLTSAAAIWVTAALGVAAGCGLWQICLLATLLTAIVLSLAKRLEDRIFPPHTEES
jgi:putative Mg2+ transporter-C (MgtC) family protein